MRLAALVESVNHVCTRYRLRAFEPLLRQAGHSFEYEELPRGWLNRWSVGRTFHDADAVILQRKLLSRIELSLLRRRSRFLVFDLDDAIWMRDSFSGKGFESGKRERRFTSTVQAADCVVGGNDFLVENAMLAGAVHGYRGLVREILVQITKELGSPKKLNVVATGGYADLIAAGLPEIKQVHPDLTLEGLRIIGTLNL